MPVCCTSVLKFCQVGRRRSSIVRRPFIPGLLWFAFDIPDGSDALDHGDDEHDPHQESGDGAEALDYIFAAGKYAGRDNSRTPTVILLDLKLPRLDGLGVLRRLREDPRTTHVPVVILTSSSQDADIVASYQLGANSYVRKPVEFGELTDTVSRVGQYWMMLNRPPTGG